MSKIFKEKQETTIFNFRLTKDERETLKEIAEANNMTVTQLIKNSLEHYIEYIEKEKKRIELKAKMKRIRLKHKGENN